MKKLATRKKAIGINGNDIVIEYCTLELIDLYLITYVKKQLSF